MTVRTVSFFNPIPAFLYENKSTSVLYLMRKSCVLLLMGVMVMGFVFMYGRGNSNTI